MKKIEVIRSAVMEAPIERVWAVLRDFGGHERWHPEVLRGQMENDFDGDVVGGVRRCSLAGGIEMREQLLQHSDRDRTFRYSILDASLPFFDSIATVRLKPVTDGDQTFWDWRIRFRTPEDRAAELEKLIGQRVCEAGFAGLRRFLSEQADLVRPSAAAQITTAADVAGEPLAAKAMVAAAFGAEALQWVDATVPAPGPRQVRLRQTAVAVNFIDLQQCQGDVPGVELPFTPGVEGVGEIVDVGPQVHGLFPGDRVACLQRKTGAYADSRCVDADACLPLPAGVTDKDASVLLKGLTAALLLTRVFRGVAGETILIESVAGGLGHLLSQWAKSMDITVIGTVSTADKARFSRERGCDYPIVALEDRHVLDEVMRITNGRGVDYWVHSHGRGSLATTLDGLSRCGHCAIIGDLRGPTAALDVNLLRRRSLTVSAPSSFDFLGDRLYLQRLAHQLFAKIQQQMIIPAVETFPLSRANEAHRRIAAGETMGAVVLIPGE